MKFKEQQRFRRWDILLLLLALIAGTAYRFFDLYIVHHISSKTQLYFSLLALFVLLAVLLLLLSFRLVTRIDEKGVRYQFFPWHYRKHRINWEDVEECTVVETPLSTELSGWTVTIGSNEFTYSFYGRTGLQLRLKDGSRIFIGTRRPEEMRQAIQSFRESQERIPKAV
jgi:hypothetical protein